MYALREVWPAEHSSSHGMLAFIAARVQKVGGGNPSGEAIGLLLARMDANADWFPGKSYQESRAKASNAGRSGTMIYAYPFTLARRAVVATMDLSAANLLAFDEDHWLSDRRNVSQLWLDAEAWVE